MGAVVVDVLHQRVEVDFHNGFVALALQHLGDVLETEDTGSFEQYCLVLEVGERVLKQEFLCGGIEIGCQFLEQRAVAHKGAADSYQLVDSALADE